MIKLFILGLCAVGFLTSCSDLDESIAFKEDGSGVYAMQADIGSMMEMMNMMAAQGQPNPFEALTKGKPDQWDTTMVMYDALSAQEKANMTNPDLYKNVKIHMDADKLRSKFAVDMTVGFQNKEELNIILKQMSNLGGSNAGTTGQALSALSGAEANWDFDGSTFTRDALPLSITDQISAMGGGMQGVRPEDLAMAKMLIGPAVFRSTISLPKEIKTVTGEGWSADGSTLTYEVPLMQMMDLKEIPGVEAQL